jgi:hypothetical protein
MPGGAMSIRGIKAMDQINSNREWNQKEGTLSEKTAFKEFGLTEDDIITAIILVAKISVRMKHDLQIERQ